MPHTKTLAIFGGPPAVTRPIPSWPITTPEIGASIQQVVADGSWGHYEGPQTKQLVSRLCREFDREHCLTCCSGTIGVELAIRGVGVKPGDEVILAGYDFPGNFRAIEAVGATPVLVDLKPDGWIIDAGAIAGMIQTRTRAVIISHLHGQTFDFSAIADLPPEIAIIEDACQVPGAISDGEPTGSFGDVSVLSFGGSKLLSAGRGGAVLSNDPLITQRIKVFADRGNQSFPLSQLQAAALLPQLDTFRQTAMRRQTGVDHLLNSLSANGWSRPLLQPNNYAQQDAKNLSAYYKLAWLLDTDLQCSRAQFIAAARAEGVPIDTGFRGFVSRSQNRCRREDKLTNSKLAATQTLLLHHPALLGSDELIEQLADGIRKVATAAAEGKLSDV